MLPECLSISQMNMENEVKMALISILERSILLMRGNASNIEAVRCEANHVHNIPQMLRHFKIELLRYYWDIERVEYIRFAPANFSASHQSDWDVLAEFMRVNPNAN